MQATLERPKADPGHGRFEKDLARAERKLNSGIHVGTPKPANPLKHMEPGEMSGPRAADIMDEAHRRHGERATNWDRKMAWADRVEKQAHKQRLEGALTEMITPTEDVEKARENLAKFLLEHAAKYEYEEPQGSELN